MIPMGIAMAAVTRVGNLIGAGQPAQRAARGVGLTRHRRRP